MMWIGNLATAVLLAVAMVPWAPAGASCDGRSCVLDTNGQPLRAGMEYFILTPSWDGHVGVLTLRKLNDTCPYYVAQGRSYHDDGLPVVFRLGSERGTEILQGEDVMVETVASNECTESNTWRLRSPSLTRKAFIATGGEPTLFRIQKSPHNWGSSNVYVLTFTGTTSHRLGMYNGWLAGPTDDSFFVEFRKVY